ncbi:DUF2695 domain-containing protein [Desulfovibrio litoralis]|uniref:DUF2695 domain-containing protein n=1 Tax=Desulfovibrio litoralis DSM 11393 TaxID=1121455 RepID=A0A1M7T1C4_9BACT|nr:DUF2695 domain-containing protein [Desulfovibrio litoralis]SHN64464.1 Protein of unknown function [Desulfovibrio litoralis DSM 11393]
MNKSEKKRLQKEYLEQQKKQFLDSLPMPFAQFSQLFDYLDAQSEENNCAHNFDMTITFLKENKIPIDNVLDWLRNHGAGCDCEVLLNTEEYFE